MKKNFKVSVNITVKDKKGIIINSATSKTSLGFKDYDIVKKAYRDDKTYTISEVYINGRLSGKYFMVYSDYECDKIMSNYYSKYGKEYNSFSIETR